MWHGNDAAALLHCDDLQGQRPEHDGEKSSLSWFQCFLLFELVSEKSLTGRADAEKNRTGSCGKFRQHTVSGRQFSESTHLRCRERYKSGRTML